jgi:hypothetical protein
LTPKRPAAKQQADQKACGKAREKTRSLTSSGILPRRGQAGLREQDHHGKGWGAKFSFHGVSWNPNPIMTAFRYEPVKARAA